MRGCWEESELERVKSQETGVGPSAEKEAFGARLIAEWYDWEGRFALRETVNGALELVRSA